MTSYASASRHHLIRPAPSASDIPRCYRAGNSILVVAKESDEISQNVLSLRGAAGSHDLNVEDRFEHPHGTFRSMSEISRPSSRCQMTKSGFLAVVVSVYAQDRGDEGEPKDPKGNGDIEAAHPPPPPAVTLQTVLKGG